MRAASAFLIALGLAGCLKPVNADTVETAWERCDGRGAPEVRAAQCSAVIDFAGATPQRRAAALIVRGSIRSNQGQHARALADLGRALRLNGADAQVYLERGIVHEALGAYDVAVRDFDSALALQPNLAPALDRRNEALAAQAAAFRQNLMELDGLLQAAPGDAALLNQRCWIRTVNSDDLDAALADCNASLAVAPNDANVLDSRGLTHFKRGEYAQSLADYEAALALEPERGHYLYGRGLARLGLGLIAEGNADLAAAETAQPGVTRSYQGYQALPPPAPAQSAD